MENPLETARRVLARHDAPALPYTELHRLVSSEIAGPAPRRDQLYRRVRGRPDLFRTLDPRRGPWRAVAGGDDGETAPYPWLEPWVLLASPQTDEGESPAEAEGRARRSPQRGDAPSRYRFPRVRESVLHLGRNLDAASPISLSRWLFIVREEHSVRSRMFRRGAARP